MDELQAFYDAAYPRLAAAMAYLDGFELSALPADATRLLWLCYSLVNVSFPIEVWHQPRVPDSGAATMDNILAPGRLTAPPEGPPGVAENCVLRHIRGALAVE